MTAAAASGGKQETAASKTRAQVAPVLLEAQQPRLDGRKVQQVADQAAHAGRFGRYPVQEPGLGLVVPRHVRGQQAAGVAPDGGERRAQLVAQAGEEIPLQLVGPAQAPRSAGGPARPLLVRAPGGASWRRLPARPTASSGSARTAQRAISAARPPGTSKAVAITCPTPSSSRGNGPSKLAWKRS